MNHDKRVKPTWTVEDRGHDTPCWIWGRSVNPVTGYGIWLSQYAHRRMYEMTVGPIPAGLEVDHLCRVRACVNPAHLEPVTSAENSRRGPSTRLTWADVTAIRASGESHVALGRRYGVTEHHIWMIRNDRCWVAA